MKFASTLRRAFRSVWNRHLKAIYFSFAHVPVFLFFLVGLYYNYRLLSRLTEDTTTITNLAFGVAATLSALSFSCARAIEGPQEAKDRFAYAGERFLHACLMVLTASALKYASVLLGVHQPAEVSQLGWRHALSLFGHGVAGVLVGVLFFYALTSAHGGMIVLNRLLWQRLTRYPDWDNFF